MRAYKNEIWDMLGNLFTEHGVMVIPRMQNQVANSLSTTAGNFKVPIYSKKNYDIEVVNKPSIPDKQVFEDDLQIKIFFRNVK